MNTLHRQETQPIYFAAIPIRELAQQGRDALASRHRA
jgi:hypothetical protein